MLNNNKQIVIIVNNDQTAGWWKIQLLREIGIGIGGSFYAVKMKTICTTCQLLPQETIPTTDSHSPKPSWWWRLIRVYSCSMPNHGSISEYLAVVNSSLVLQQIMCPWFQLTIPSGTTSAKTQFPALSQAPNFQTVDPHWPPKHLEDLCRRQGLPAEIRSS